MKSDSKMKKLPEIFKVKKRTFSFELFPPKTKKGYQNLKKTLSQLVKLKPDFISCTYGAGGGNREKTLDIVELIEKKHKTTSVAHLTCVLHTKEEINAILHDIQSRGVCNILALKGDAPVDQPDWEPTEDNFKYSSQLCAFIRENFKDYFGIGVAGFPEGHPEAPNLSKDREFLKEKIENGADFVITQLFFDNHDYFQYVEELKEIGVTARIIPGILPITNYAGLLKFCETCKTTITEEIKTIFEPIADDPQKTLGAGIQFAVKQCKELLDGGAPGVHFYCLNKVHPVDTILKQIK